MQLFYRHYGEGQPVIILHGLFGISDNWVTIGRRLAEKFEVFIPDQRNHGQSPHSDIFNYYALTEDLFEFIENHKLVNPVLIGHSMGGKVAMNFALKYPHKVNKLIIVDMSVRKYSARQTHINIINAMLSIDFDNIKSREDVSAIIPETIKPPGIKQLILKNLYRINRNKLGWRMNVQAIFDNIENVLEGIESPYTFDKPSLFIKGSNSDYILKEDYELIRKNFPNAEFHTIENTSHWVHAEKPDELYAVFFEFV